MDKRPWHNFWWWRLSINLSALSPVATYQGTARKTDYNVHGRVPLWFSFSPLPCRTFRVLINIWRETLRAGGRLPNSTADWLTYSKYGRRTSYAESCDRKPRNRGSDHEPCGGKSSLCWRRVGLTPFLFSVYCERRWWAFRFWTLRSQFLELRTRKHNHATSSAIAQFPKPH